MYKKDKRIVVTLDAGGTNFVFGAMRGCEYITEPLTLPSCAGDLDRCLGQLVNGFREIINGLPESRLRYLSHFPARQTMPMASLEVSCRISPHSATE